VDFLRAQIGIPYLWGGEGPATGGFDCSGLSMKAWEAVGVSLTHQSGIQWSQTARVAKADLKPGDLVFFGSPIHHLGVYIGEGKMIEAPREGTLVRIASINRRDLVGGGRIRS
jgi:peptidoglycan DL-endopeptidase CwlO